MNLEIMPDNTKERESCNWQAKDDKIYQYDIMEIKKEMSNLFQSDDLTQ